MRLGEAVVSFQPRHDLLAPKSPKAWEKRVLLVGRGVWGGFGEVAQRRRKGIRVVRGERFPSVLFRDSSKNP